MYENLKMRHVETIPGMGGGGERTMMEGKNSTLMNYKNFCNCHNVP
jgi:hypothetical protein